MKMSSFQLRAALLPEVTAAGSQSVRACMGFGSCLDAEEWRKISCVCGILKAGKPTVLYWMPVTDAKINQLDANENIL
jgi:hypothetical protein